MLQGGGLLCLGSPGWTPCPGPSGTAKQHARPLSEQCTTCWSLREGSTWHRLQGQPRLTLGSPGRNGGAAAARVPWGVSAVLRAHSEQGLLPSQTGRVPRRRVLGEGMVLPSHPGLAALTPASTRLLPAPSSDGKQQQSPHRLPEAQGCLDVPPGARPWAKLRAQPADSSPVPRDTPGLGTPARRRTTARVPGGRACCLPAVAGRRMG